MTWPASGTIQTSFAAGSVSGSTDSWPVGGLVGYAEGGLFRDSYATASVTAPEAGGFGGQIDGDVVRSFAVGNVTAPVTAISGFIGVYNGSEFSSFFDEYTTGTSDLGSATPLPTEPTGVFSVLDIGPAGGWIFYDKGLYSDGWRYLEAAPSDVPSSGWRTRC